jgi:hypothetical protein
MIDNQIVSGFSDFLNVFASPHDDLVSQYLVTLNVIRFVSFVLLVIFFMIQLCVISSMTDAVTTFKQCYIVEIPSPSLHNLNFFLPVIDIESLIIMLSVLYMQHFKHLKMLSFF